MNYALGYQNIPFLVVVYQPTLYMLPTQLCALNILISLVQYKSGLLIAQYGKVMMKIEQNLQVEQGPVW